MSQWGFYFNQARCLGCKTCITACKNWNELRRGDAKIHKMVLEQYMVKPGAFEDKTAYQADDNTTNWQESGKYYMKENWRRLDTYDRGATIFSDDGRTFTSDFDRRYISLSCNHCDKPVCIDICPTANISKDVDTGAVLVGEGCISCGRCKIACPWDAPQFYDEDYASYTINDPARPKMTKCTMCYDRINIGLKPACVAACWNRALDAGPIQDLINEYGGIRTLDNFDDNSLEPNIIFKAK